MSAGNMIPGVDEMMTRGKHLIEYNEEDVSSLLAAILPNPDQILWLNFWTEKEDGSEIFYIFYASPSRAVRSFINSMR